MTLTNQEMLIFQINIQNDKLFKNVRFDVVDQEEKEKCWWDRKVDNTSKVTKQ